MIKTIEEAEYLSDDIINDKIGKIESKLSLIEKIVSDAQKNINAMKMDMNSSKDR